MENHLLNDKNEILKMSTMIDTLLSQQKIMKDTDKLNEILNFIRKRKSVTKKEVIDFVGWGRGIKWTPYRRALMQHRNIKDINDSEPRYVWT